MLMFGSCRDLTELNINPNNVSEAHPQLLLTTIEWGAFQLEGSGPLYPSRMVVQTDGENNGQYYNWDRSDFGSYFRLRDVTKMIEEAERVESDAYLALGKFFRAHYFYGLALTFGDIPYTEALQGESNSIYAPLYDEQKNVFIGILKELSEANDLLDGNTETIFGDIIFSGSTEKWRKLVNSYRLKVLMTLSKKEGEAGLNLKGDFSAIVSGQPLMESIADNGQLVFINQSGSQYTNFNNSGWGSAFYMDSTFIKRLQDRKDPRLFIYSDRTKNAKEAGLAEDDFSAYEGGNPVAPYANGNEKAIVGNISKPNLRYTIDPVNEPGVLLGYSELQLILSEAAVRGWIAGSAASYYEKGVRASFEFYNKEAENYSAYVTDAAATSYLAEPLVDFAMAGTPEEKIELIITQMYLQSFMQSGWTMYFNNLRTGYPAFLHRSPAETPPTRWIYPIDEYQQNEVNVKAAVTRQYGGNDAIREVPWWLK